MPASPVGYVPTSCPICKQRIWSGKMMTSPVPRQLYREHLTQNHPDFARWDKRMSLFLAPIIILVIASTLLFVGSFAGDSLSSGTLVSGLFFAFSLAVTPIFAFVRKRGKRRFQESWDAIHPIGTLSSAAPDSSFQQETTPSGAHSQISSLEDYVATLSL